MNSGQFKKGHKSISYWSGKKNPGLSERNKLRMQGENNPAWKGGISKTSSYRVHYNRIRKAQLKNAIGTYSFEEWTSLKKRYNHTCLICKRKEPEIKLTADHIRPLSRGGSNWLDNIQPLCGSCNSKKHAKVFEFAQKTATLIVGAGEIGIALYDILKDHYKTFLIDKHSKCLEPITYLHIAFPYDEQFILNVSKYQEIYQPIHTIIHSTVPVGTCKQLNAISSPCRGIHPELEQGIRTFSKFLGGVQASEVADYFRRAGLRVVLYDKSETTEALKLFDTEYYRVCIEFAHRVKKYCNEHDLNFSEVYTIPNQTYNEGYTKLGMPEVVRPVLQPIMTPIGGHCVIPNSKLI